jgi:hypothetical protein
MLMLDNCSRSRTYQRIQEHVEASSCVHLRKLHYSIELKSSNFETGVCMSLAANVRKLLVKVMLLL